MLTPGQMRMLSGDAAYNDRVSGDPELMRLQRESARDDSARFDTLALAMGGAVDIGGIVIPPPTAYHFLVLGEIDNAVLCGGRAITPSDVDTALYIFGMGADAIVGIESFDNLAAAADGICRENNVELATAYTGMMDVIAASLAPFAVLPSNSGGDPGARYDLQWYASFSASVARAARMPASYCGRRMPMAMACAYFVESARFNGAKTMRQKPVEKIMERIEEIAEERLMELGA